MRKSRSARSRRSSSGSSMRTDRVSFQRHPARQVVAHAALRVTAEGRSRRKHGDNPVECHVDAPSEATGLPRLRPRLSRGLGSSTPCRLRLRPRRHSAANDVVVEGREHCGMAHGAATSSSPTHPPAQPHTSHGRKAAARVGWVGGGDAAAPWRSAGSAHIIAAASKTPFCESLRMTREGGLQTRPEN